MRITFGDVVNIASRLFGWGDDNNSSGSAGAGGGGLFSGLFGQSSASGRSSTVTRNTRHKQYIKKLMDTPFRQGWQFRVEVDGQPADFEIYVKDISYGGLTLEYESKTVGAQTFNYPDHKTAGDVTLTVRDHLDGRVENWFYGLAAKVVNQNGTVNLPPEYLFVMRLYRVLDERGNEQLEKEWLVSAAECGEHTMAMEQVTEFLTFPLVFKKFKAL